jgi:hypothetical protein
MNLKTLGGCKPKPAIYRFNMSYKKDEHSGCWIWQGKSKSGSSKLYGRIKVNKKNVPAHRFSWEIHNNQEVPEKMFVLHKCDNPGCVNPDHLFVGTHQDNMNDKVLKNRQAKGSDFKNRKAAIGSKNGLSKLTEKQAMEIYLDERPQRIISKDYEVTQTVVHNIKSQKTWRHIHG